jgi:K+-transporting ATPase KdpF subunit
LSATGCEAAMSFDYALACIVTIGIAAYLLLALIYPEKF